ncbi:unnamed protein product [Bemisia tabaci]|uniref:Heme haloperoxidase family profile domain-containing protein n=1 Tax=Bemisia tabaci TaxID=7038 RepID=A0A9P0F1Q1_BEMTA|nr:unnamed protein product [Bemisia tabaci]
MRTHLPLSTLVFIAQGILVHPEVAQDCPYQSHREGPNLQIRRIKPTFNAEAQRVDVSGKHAFKPPGPKDQRGPCPGLNAMANHNYIPHNGITTLSDMIEGAYKVFGLAPDLGLILGMAGIGYAGNLRSVSIGGPSDEVSAGPFPTPQGLSYSHNKFELDSSPTRGDLYMYGDAAKLQLSQFKDLLDMGKGPNPNYDFDTADAFYEKQYPEGFLDRETLKSFYAVSGDDDNLIYTPGHERIPFNWYKRAIGDEVNAGTLVERILTVLPKYPQFFQIGGNTGKVDSFVGLDLANLTGNVYSLPTLLQGNNLVCFMYQAMRSTYPDVLNGMVEVIDSIVFTALSSVFNAQTLLSCPRLTQLNTTLYSMYPGYTELLQDGTYNSTQYLNRELRPDLPKY